MPRTKQISIAINSLVQGGAQKAGILLAGSLKERGYSVQLILFYPEETDFFQIPEGITVVRLIHPFEGLGIHYSNKYKTIYYRGKSRLMDLYQLRKEIKRHESSHVIAFEVYVGILVGLALFASKIKVLISERVHPQYHEVQDLVKPFKQFVYKLSNVRILAQGEVISEFIRKKFDVEVLSIPNIVQPPPKDFVHTPQKRVVMMARANHQKGIDLLLKAWAQLSANQKSTWTVHIYGQGNFEPFEEMTQDLKINDEIFFHEATPDINKILGIAGIFVLPSRYEGFSNALAEAISYGIPSIATDCPSAVRDLTVNGTLARLIPMEDTNSLAFELCTLIENEEDRISLGKNAKNISKIFGSDQVTDIWEDAIDGLFKKKSKIHCTVCNKKNLSLRLSISKAQLLQSYKNSYHPLVIPNDLFSSLEKIIRFWECQNCGHMSTKSGGTYLSYYDFMHKNTTYARSSVWDYVYISKKLRGLQGLQILDFGSSHSKWGGLDIEKNLITLYDITLIEKDSNFPHIKYTNNMQEIPSKSVDHIVALHVLEHLEDPLQALSILKSKMKSDGKIWISVPDKDNSFAQFSHLDWPPHHVSRFSKESLKYLAERAGLRLVDYVPGVNNSYGMFDFMMEFEHA
jgi:glycosyltransferase involved in cell wall biosynthesis